MAEDDRGPKGRARPEVDLLIAQRMAYGVIGTEADPVTARASARRALEVVDPDLSW